MTRSSCVRRGWPSLALALLAIAMMPVVALAAPADVRLEYSPMARASEVVDLQELAANDWLPRLYVSLPPELQKHITVLAVENLEHGVEIRVEVEGSELERRQVQEVTLQKVQALADQAGLKNAYNLTAPGRVPGLPLGPLPVSRRRLAAGAGAIALVGLVLAAWVLGRRRFLSLPAIGALPVLGLLPAGIGMGGRFLELQGQPSQALGFFFRRLAALARTPFREAVVLAQDDLEASAAATACLSIALLREHGRVLVIDLAGDASALPAILEETDDAGEQPLQGSLRPTSIADLDLLTGLEPFEHRKPPLPADLLARYRWVIYHAPLGEPLERMRHLLVVSGPISRGAIRSAKQLAWWRRAKVLGLVLVGSDASSKLRDRYLARYYFERLKAQEQGA